MKGKFLRNGLIIGLLLVILAGLIPTMSVMADNGPWGGINVFDKDLSWAALYAKDTTTWINISQGARGQLLYINEGPQFCFSFTADKLDHNTGYSLIYYADTPNRFVDWGGNYPGAFIASGTSDSKGAIWLKGSVNLGMDLPSQPDANFGVGAKVWLVPSKDYDPAACKVIVWDPTKFLFDDASRLVNYHDTDVLSTKLVQKDSSWTPINTTTNFGWLWYTPKGKTFGYKFNGYGLTPSTAYSLIYYPDPWNNPAGALIATGTSDASGFLNIHVGADALNKNLPVPTDSNIATGAKIWLVPSSDYSSSTHLFTTWNPYSNYLLDTQLIKYTYK